MNNLIYTGFLKNGSVIILVENQSTYTISEIDKHGISKQIEVLSKSWHNNDSAKAVAVSLTERTDS